MKIALAQINTLVGDIAGNADKIIVSISEAAAAGADMVLLPELAVVGYPPKDLLLKKSFIDANLRAVQRIAGATRGTTAVVGHVQPTDADRGKGLINAVSVCANGEITATHGKTLLPTYDVFDESRYFDRDPRVSVSEVDFGGKATKVGFSVCEDLWSDDQYLARRLYDSDPAADLVQAGAELIVNIGASPFSLDKPQRRIKLFGAKAKRFGVPLVYVNLVGGNDDLVFDGSSGAIDGAGRLVALAKSFSEDFLIVDLKSSGNRREPLPEGIASIHDALVLGTCDYVDKCGFEAVVMGVSGGIDSAVTAAIAVEALGSKRVHLVAMPSRYSSGHSLSDAQALCKALGISMRTIPIDDIHSAAEKVLEAHFEGRSPDITEENIQARARGVIQMALSNKFGWLLLTTGNKSELAVGYCTLYGDMCGGLAVLSDVPKMTVYALAHHINERAGRELIPQSTINKVPSAELRENQTDQDTLPPYEILDAVLECYIERDQSVTEIVAAGFDETIVREVVRMVDRNEYKRKQAPVGLKVTSRAFGTGRRMPIAARYT